MLKERQAAWLYRRMSPDCDYSDFRYMLSEWGIEQMSVNGRCVGMFLVRGHEVHIEIIKRAALRYSRQVIRKYVAVALRKLGYLTTVAFKDDPNIAQFLTRLGFYETKRSGEFVWYRLDSLRIY